MRDEDEWARRVCLGTEGAEVASWDGDDCDDEDYDFGIADSPSGFLGDYDDIM